MSKRAASVQTTLDGRQLKRNKASPQDQSSADELSTKLMKRILVIGLNGRSPGHGPPSSAKFPRGRFRQGLQAVAAEAKKSGLELDIMQVKASAFPSELKKLKGKLQERPDGMVVGFGIRGTADYTTFFEDLINASREIAPQTRLAFNTSPDDILECCLRNFGPEKS